MLQLKEMMFHYAEVNMINQTIRYLENNIQDHIEVSK